MYNSNCIELEYNEMKEYSHFHEEVIALLRPKTQDNQNQNTKVCEYDQKNTLTTHWSITYITNHHAEQPTLSLSARCKTRNTTYGIVSPKM